MRNMTTSPKPSVSLVRKPRRSRLTSSRLPRKGRPRGPGGLPERGGNFAGVLRFCLPPIECWQSSIMPTFRVFRLPRWSLGQRRGRAKIRFSGDLTLNQAGFRRFQRHAVHDRLKNSLHYARATTVRPLFKSHSSCLSVHSRPRLSPGCCSPIPIGRDNARPVWWVSRDHRWIVPLLAVP
jgi:hypothetical protein